MNTTEKSIVIKAAEIAAKCATKVASMSTSSTCVFFAYQPEFPNLVEDHTKSQEKSSDK